MAFFLTNETSPANLTNEIVTQCKIASPKSKIPQWEPQDPKHSKPHGNSPSIKANERT